MMSSSMSQRRQQRAQDFANQNIKKAKNFDFDQHNRKDVEGTHVSGQEVKHLNKTFGKKEAYKALQAQKDAGATFGKYAENRFNRMGARIEARERAKANKGSTGNGTNAVDDAQSGEGDNVNSNNTMASNNVNNSQTQTVTQDNDLISEINGHNNTVIQTQDNSVRNYGGDNRSFVYNSSGGKKGQMYDTPATMATLSGFYDVDDSPAAQAGFVDMYSTLNADNQKRYAGSAMETFAEFGNLDARSYTDESMEINLNRSLQDSFDRADTQTGLVFGDIWNDNYITESWKMPSAPSEIKSNAKEIADDAKDRIEDL